MLFNFNNIQIISDKILNKLSGARSINITNRPTLFSTVNLRTYFTYWFCVHYKINLNKLNTETNGMTCGNSN